MEDELDYAALAANAEAKAKSADTLHLAALWRELAVTYRELGDYHRGRGGRIPAVPVCGPDHPLTRSRGTRHTLSPSEAG
jgi:hypothetical protein